MFGQPVIQEKSQASIQIGIRNGMTGSKWMKYASYIWDKGKEKTNKLNKFFKKEEKMGGKPQWSLANCYSNFYNTL